METKQAPQPLPPPPSVTPAIKAGMDAISVHLSILLLPLGLDLLLWFGPRLSIQPLFASLLEQMKSFGVGGAMKASDVEAAQQMLTEWLSRFNLLSVLRTFPVGVSSLMTAKQPAVNPLGGGSVVEVHSGVGLIGWLFLLTVLGWVAGGLYFHWVSKATGSRETNFGGGRAVTQTVLFSVLLAVAAFMVGMPVMFVVGIVGLISPNLLQILLFILALFSAWIVVPVFFSAHGIFLRGQNAFYSIYAGLRMARFTLPSSSMFVLAVFVISQGLNYLWAIPADNSWMLLVGMAGHAFVTTALLAASFIYYHDMSAWLELVFQRLKPDATAQQT
ncbi:MAG: hypothetical protein QY329_03185 [Anaerolineales bacterium]|nr:MAG: hypothetical protein QY329_03185 [Anaerolineales bacterium]